MLASIHHGDLGTLVAVLLALVVLACAAVTVVLLYRGAWVAGAVAAVVTIVFAVYLL